MEGVELEFEEEALRQIAKKALLRKIGARGLRAILENILLDTMYDLPSIEGINKVIINDKVISGDGKPLLVFSEESGAGVAAAGGE